MSAPTTGPTRLNDLMARVEMDPNGGCWLWSGYLVGPLGYGGFRLGPITKAHRASWVMHKGPIPDGLCVLHRCDVPSCVNPDHLWLGTYADNNADRAAKGRGSKGHVRRVRTYGEGQSTAKLSNEAVRIIRASSESNAVLAARFGVARKTVSHVRHGRARNNDHLGRTEVAL